MANKTPSLPDSLAPAQRKEFTPDMVEYLARVVSIAEKAGHLEFSPEVQKLVTEQRAQLAELLKTAPPDLLRQVEMARSTEAAKRRVDTRKDRPDREGTRMLAAHFDSDVYREFKVLAAEHGQNTNTLLNRAVELLFESFGRKPPKNLRKKLATHGL